MPAKKLPKAVKSTPKGAETMANISIKPLTAATLENLNAFLKKSGLGEIEIKQGDASVRLARPGSGMAHHAPAPAAHPVSEAIPAAPLNTFNAPMIGTFYRAPSPEAQPFCKVGDTIRAGQVLCVIEAMKTMNQIEADRAGKIVKILADNATPVEFGQPLFVIE